VTDALVLHLDLAVELLEHLGAVPRAPILHHWQLWDLDGPRGLGGAVARLLLLLLLLLVVLGQRRGLLLLLLGLQRRAARLLTAAAAGLAGRGCARGARRVCRRACARVGRLCSKDTGADAAQGG
jgi:hypothetical protein